jgi:riboflavin biosynthesis pyrimidine reductase
MERFTRLTPGSARDLSAADLAAAIPPPATPADRPFLALNMIATADGRATVAGRTGPIANRADYELFHALRTRVDAVMVGAETVRVEGYGRMVPDPEAREARVRSGLAADPLAVVVTRSVRLPPGVGLLAAPENRVVVITPSPDRELGPTAATVEYVREPDIGTGLRRLRADHGVRSVLCEGGPGLNAHLIPEGLADELHLVVAPKLAGGRDPLTILDSDPVVPVRELELLSLHESGGYLFLRYAIGG